MIGIGHAAHQSDPPPVSHGAFRAWRCEKHRPGGPKSLRARADSGEELRGDGAGQARS